MLEGFKAFTSVVKDFMIGSHGDVIPWLEVGDFHVEAFFFRLGVVGVSLTKTRQVLSCPAPASRD